MSRLTSKAYLEQRAHLRHLWFDKNGHPMEYLRPMEQWDLHAYFAPVDSFSEARALQYRKQTSSEQPSLPQKAGRAYAHLLEVERELAAIPVRPVAPKGGKRTNHRGKEFNIQARPLVRPTIDYDKLARAFMEMARLEEEKRRRESDSS